MKKLLLVLSSVFALGIAANGQLPLAVGSRSVQVLKFDVANGVDFPPAWLDTLRAEIVDELTQLKKFNTVAAADGNITDIGLTGTVTRYTPGSKSTRLWIGMGAGAAKAVAKIRILDSSGKLLLEKEVDGKVIKGTWGGGDANGVTRGVAKEIAKDVKKELFK